MIKKIDDYDTRDMRHVDAQNLLQNSETIKLVVERSESPRATTSSRITTDTTITALPSPSTVFKSNFGDRAAVTSLSECNTISIITRFFDCHHNDIRCCCRVISPRRYVTPPLINSLPQLISFFLLAKHN